MRAAKAAAAVRAKADAERAANPLVRIFGSQTQNEAKLAEAQLQQALATRLTNAEQPRVRRVVYARNTETGTTSPPGRQALRPPKYDSTGSVGRNGPALAVGEDGSRQRNRSASTDVESIVFDLASGIKTIHMADGTVEEE